MANSPAIDPWGEVLLDMGEAPKLGSAEIDLARLEDIRSRDAGAAPPPPIHLEIVA